jgi:hypothetical protein
MPRIAEIDGIISILRPNFSTTLPSKLCGLATAHNGNGVSRIRKPRYNPSLNSLRPHKGHQ